MLYGHQEFSLEDNYRSLKEIKLSTNTPQTSTEDDNLGYVIDKLVGRKKLLRRHYIKYAGTGTNLLMTFCNLRPAYQCTLKQYSGALRLKWLLTTSTDEDIVPPIKELGEGKLWSNKWLGMVKKQVKYHLVPAKILKWRSRSTMSTT